MYWLNIVRIRLFDGASMAANYKPNEHSTSPKENENFIRTTERCSR